MSFTLPSPFIKDPSVRDNLRAIAREMNMPTSSYTLSEGGTRCHLRFVGNKLVAEVDGVSKVVADWSV